MSTPGLIQPPIFPWLAWGCGVSLAQADYTCMNSPVFELSVSLQILYPAQASSFSCSPQRWLSVLSSLSGTPSGSRPHSLPCKWSVSLRKLSSLSINSFIFFFFSWNPIPCLFLPSTCPLDFKYPGFQQDPTLSKSSRDHTLTRSVCCVFTFIISHSVHSPVHCISPWPLWKD